jgi:hypothetical protein
MRLWVRISPDAWMSVLSVVCCQVEVSATSWSLVQRSPTDCGSSLCVIQKPREWGGAHWGGRGGGCRGKNKRKKKTPDELLRSTIVKDAQIPGNKSPYRLNFVGRPLMFVGPQHAVCCMSPIGCLEFWGVSYTPGKSVLPCHWYVSKYLPRGSSTNFKYAHMEKCYHKYKVFPPSIFTQGFQRNRKQDHLGPCNCYPWHTCAWQLLIQIT